MSVPNQTPYNIYNANGQTTVFPFEFYIISASDIQVSINGEPVASGYSVSGVGNSRGGDVIFLMPPAKGKVVMLERVVPTFRLTDYQDNGDLLADTVNKDFDRIWMAIQRSFLFINRTLRVPEMTGVNNLPSVEQRRNKLLAFNNDGNPITVVPGSGSAADVMIELAKPGGAKRIGTESGTTLQDVINNYADRIATCEKNSRYENFHTLLDTCTAELLSLNAPEAYDQSITLTINEKLTTDYTGQITGSCNILNPQNYTLILCTSSTLEYQSASLVLNADGTFHFSRSWPGAKSFRLTRTATGGLLTVWEDPLCIRSYHMPTDAGGETVRVMKDRTYTYDQAVSAIALMAQGHSQSDKFASGLCAIVGSGGSVGSVPFFVNRMSAQTSSQYYRTGNAAWVAYALAYYLLKFPNGGMETTVREKLIQCVEWIETFRVNSSADTRYGLYTSGSGRYLNGVFYPDFDADWCTAEHQFDLWFLFDLMGRIGFAGYADKAADLADSIIEKLWVESEGSFRAGMRVTGPDNASPLDCSSWGGLFVANIDIEKARRCLSYLDRFWYATHDATGYTPYHPRYGYPNKQRGVWVEGSAGVALLARRLGLDDMALDILSRLAPLRTRYGYIDSSDYPDNDDMPPWPSSCNTAWMMLAMKPEGFWNVDLNELSAGYHRY